MRDPRVAFWVAYRARLMDRWHIPFVKGPHDNDRLDVVCSALMQMRPALQDLLSPA